MLAVSCKTTEQYRSCRRGSVLTCEAFLRTFIAYLCAVYDVDTFKIQQSFSERHGIPPPLFITKSDSLLHKIHFYCTGRLSSFTTLILLHLFIPHLQAACQSPTVILP